MGFLVQDKVEISVFIDDNEYPLSTTNLLNWLHITTSVRHGLPMFGLQITDVEHRLDTIGLSDGTPIRIVVKPNNKESKTYLFRKYNHKREFSGDSFAWTLTGYWDAPRWWAESTNAAIEGTSNAVLAELAERSGLKYDGTTTNDYQIWMPRNRTLRAWAKDIVDHSWASDTSCMVLGVDLDGTLRFKDVNNLPAPSQKIIEGTYASDAMTAVDIHVSANSGLNNALTGYQSMRISQSTMTDDTHQIIKDLSFTPDVKTPLYNEEIKAQIEQASVRFAPIDAGNVHDNYERASYQNLRYRNLFSMGLEALMTDTIDVQLMEKLTIALQVEDTAQDTPNSGVYTVTGHALYTQGANYAEKIGVARHGDNSVQR